MLKNKQKVKKLKKKLPEEVEDKRTLRQNRSMHLWFDTVSAELIDNDIDMKMLLSKYQLDVPITPLMVKEWLWKRVQISMYGKKSTTKLTTKEVTTI